MLVVAELGGQGGDFLDRKRQVGPVQRAFHVHGTLLFHGGKASKLGFGILVNRRLENQVVKRRIRRQLRRHTQQADWRCREKRILAVQQAKHVSGLKDFFYIFLAVSNPSLQGYVQSTRHIRYCSSLMTYDRLTRQTVQYSETSLNKRRKRTL